MVIAVFFLCKIVSVAHSISHSPSNECAQANKQINRVKCRSTTLLRVFVFVVATCANTFTHAVALFRTYSPIQRSAHCVLFWTSLCLYFSRTTPFFLIILHRSFQGKYLSIIC